MRAEEAFEKTQRYKEGKVRRAARGFLKWLCADLRPRATQFILEKYALRVRRTRHRML